MTYEPREDSYLLLEAVKRYAYGKALEIGTGTGILAIEAAKLKKVKAVTATDISKDALVLAERNANRAGAGVNKKIRFIQSYLFKKLKKQKFDTIIINPPYLPEDREFRDKAIHGGKKGYELIERFFSEVNDYLDDGGIILLVFSSLTKRAKVDEAIENYGFEKALLEEKSIFFEELFVYSVKKSELLKKLNRRRIRGVKKLTRGHRGIIYSGCLGKKKVAVKVERTDIAAKDVATKEAKWLRLLNKRCIGPTILYSDKNYFISEFVKGSFIAEFIKNNKKKKIKNVLQELFNQCFTLDKLKINKEEMHHPIKHVIVSSKGKVVLIDFERAHKTRKPKNVTQLCQFIINENMRKTLRNKGIRTSKDAIISAAKNYRKNPDKERLNKIIELIK